MTSTRYTLWPTTYPALLLLLVQACTEKWMASNIVYNNCNIVNYNCSIVNYICNIANYNWSDIWIWCAKYPVRRTETETQLCECWVVESNYNHIARRLHPILWSLGCVFSYYISHCIKKASNFMEYCMYSLRGTQYKYQLIAILLRWWHPILWSLRCCMFAYSKRVVWTMWWEQV